jgi:hypothetical protein
MEIWRGVKLAMTTKDFLYCLGSTESRDDPNAPLGDGGRALGRFQWHPDAVWTNCRRFGIQPTLNEPWDSFLTRIVVAFYEHFIPSMEADEVAMYFHMGHRVQRTDTDWDAGYQQRFQGYAAEISKR